MNPHRSQDRKRALDAVTGLAAGPGRLDGSQIRSGKNDLMFNKHLREKIGKKIRSLLETKEPRLVPLKILNSVHLVRRPNLDFPILVEDKEMFC